MDNQHRRRKSFMKKTIPVYIILFVSFFSHSSFAMEEEEESFLKTISKRRVNVDNKSKLEELPGEILEAICFELQPKDIVNLSMTSTSLRALTTDKFWERYIRVHHQKKWSSAIPAIKVAFAYSLFDKGKILQAAQLDLPQARARLEYDQTTKKRMVENSNKKESSFLEQANNLVRSNPYKIVCLQSFPFFPSLFLFKIL